MGEFLRFEEKIIEGENAHKEDGGCARIAEIRNRVHHPAVIRLYEFLKKELHPISEDKGLFVRLISWDESEEHEDFKRLMEAGKVRVIIELLDEGGIK